MHVWHQVIGAALLSFTLSQQALPTELTACRSMWNDVELTLLSTGFRVVGSAVRSLVSPVVCMQMPVGWAAAAHHTRLQQQLGVAQLLSYAHAVVSSDREAGTRHNRRFTVYLECMLQVHVHSCRHAASHPQQDCMIWCLTAVGQLESPLAAEVSFTSTFADSGLLWSQRLALIASILQLLRTTDSSSGPVVAPGKGGGHLCKLRPDMSSTTASSRMK